MKQINKPESQIQEVLYYLITRIKIDRRQMMLSVGVLNLPDQIMRLRNKHNLTIDLNEVITTNKFGRQIKHGEYILRNKKEAADIYRDIQEEHLLRNLKE